MKHLLTGAALGALIAVSPALAQTTPQTPPPTTQAPAATTTPGTSGTTTGTTAGGTSASTTATLTTSPDDISASRLIGSTIRNAANETVGDINDIVLDKSGRVKAVVAGVGGFLGIGERNVALRFDQLQMNRDSGGRPYMLTNMTRDNLRTLPEWQQPGSSTSTTTR